MTGCVKAFRCFGPEGKLVQIAIMLKLLGFLVLFASRVECFPSTQTFEDFKRSNGIRLDYELELYTLQNGKIDFEGEVLDVDQAPRFNIYSKGSGLTSNQLQKSTTSLGRHFLVYRDTDNNIVHVVVASQDGSSTYLVLVEGDTMVKVLSSALENMPMTLGRGGEMKDYKRSEGSNRRSLQSPCDTIREVEVAIAYDSTFCSQFGDRSLADSEIERILSESSMKYEVSGLCFELKLVHIDAQCDASTDPYSRLFSETPNTGCKTADEIGLLDTFSDYWNANRTSVTRDIAHLFLGSEFENEISVGCAWADAVCSSDIGYGIDQMTSQSNILRTLIFAHELGHNFGTLFHYFPW